MGVKLWIKINQPIGKLYYSIGEIAERFDVAPSLIRFWEKEFDFLSPRKDKKGKRLFTDKDIEHFQLVYSLVKERGYTLDGAKSKLKSNFKQTQHNVEVVNRLKRIRGFLVELKTLVN